MALLVDEPLDRACLKRAGPSLGGDQSACLEREGDRIHVLARSVRELDLDLLAGANVLHRGGNVVPPEKAILVRLHFFDQCARARNAFAERPSDIARPKGEGCGWDDQLLEPSISSGPIAGSSIHDLDGSETQARLKLSDPLDALNIAGL